MARLIFPQLINLIWGLNFHIFEPEEPEGHEMYDTKIVVHQHQWFGPFPISYKEIADEDTQEALFGIMSAVTPEKMKPFQYLSEREICNADKAFVLKIMKLDPRDRPTVKELLQDEWFTERSERTVGWYSKEEWQQMQQQAGPNSLPVRPGTPAETPCRPGRPVCGAPKPNVV
jgi:serine/threonine protein kinase